MRFTLIVFLTLNLTAFSQNKKIDEINRYITSIDSNSDLKINEYDWSKVTGTHIDKGAILKIWKKNNEIVKIKEEFGASYGRCIRLIYLKNSKPIKAIETEENFEFKNNEIDYTSLKLQFKIQVFVTGFNKVIDEYEFDVIKEGKRKLTEYYCDLNEVFAIRNEISNL
ncbi:hypothetical protein GCM10009430_48480 [Aquimarina litoralis]|uniref:DUF4468 domain-containing protein n=1 Tax=Aquimarina litoralis TaxID=584605 RepID=A0ABP3UKN5_9FLAO